MIEPAKLASDTASGRRVARLSGAWTLAALPNSLAQFNEFDTQLQALAGERPLWDLSAVTRLDSAGALMLWRAWGKSWPSDAIIPDDHRHVMERADGSAYCSTSHVNHTCDAHSLETQYTGK